MEIDTKTKWFRTSLWLESFLASMVELLPADNTRGKTRLITRKLSVRFFESLNLFMQVSK